MHPLTLSPLIALAHLVSAAPACPHQVTNISYPFNLYLSSANPKFNNYTLVFSPPDPSAATTSPTHLMITPTLPLRGAGYPLLPLTLKDGTLSVPYKGINWNALNIGPVPGLKPEFDPINFANSSQGGPMGGADQKGWVANVGCDGKTTLAVPAYKALNVLINQLSAVPKDLDSKDWPPVTVEVMSADMTRARCGSSGVCLGNIGALASA
ncbi:MAG: hypothetical protein M1814_004049 [Vezdaea aestivalis]|nr:MAG: hypothetical protein M1814_004049 [Vezdaea aestivalis]